MFNKIKETTKRKVNEIRKMMHEENKNINKEKL